jgi:hypothetical protein
LRGKAAAGRCISRSLGSERSEDLQGNIVFQPLTNGKPSGDYIIFADGFAGGFKDPGKATHRPSEMWALMVLYVSDDIKGRIWRITFTGDPNTTGLEAAPAPKSREAASSLLHDQLIDWNAGRPQASVMKLTEALQHDDGFHAPNDAPEAAYVTWDGEETHNQCIFFLHGALHLYDYGHELQKKCWERSGGIPWWIRYESHLMKDGSRSSFRKDAAKENSTASGNRPICIKDFVALLRFAGLWGPAFSFSATLWLPTMRIF